MAVLINMEMPQACFDCRFINDYVPGIYTCVIAAKSTKIINQRPKWCPLMDSDAVKAKLENPDCGERKPMNRPKGLNHEQSTNLTDAGMDGR